MAPFRRDPEGQKPPGEFLLEVGWGRSKERQVRSRKFPHLPPEALPKKAHRGLRLGDLACMGWVLGGGVGRSSEHSKTNCPSLGSTCPGLSLATVLTWELRSPQSQRQRCLPLTEKTFIEYLLCTRLPTPRPCQLLPCCLTKPAYPVCWDKFLADSTACR